MLDQQLDRLDVARLGREHPPTIADGLLHPAQGEVDLAQATEDRRRIRTARERLLQRLDGLAELSTFFVGAGSRVIAEGLDLLLLVDGPRPGRHERLGGIFAREGEIDRIGPGVQLRPGRLRFGLLGKGRSRGESAQSECQNHQRATFRTEHDRVSSAKASEGLDRSGAHAPPGDETDARPLVDGAVSGKRRLRKIARTGPADRSPKPSW